MLFDVRLNYKALFFWFIDYFKKYIVFFIIFVTFWPTKWSNLRKNEKKNCILYQNKVYLSRIPQKLAFKRGPILAFCEPTFKCPEVFYLRTFPREEQKDFLYNFFFIFVFIL